MDSLPDPPLRATADRPFYVYVLLRPDGRVFYVGKGQKNRAYKHEAEARTKCNCHKCRVIRKVWKSGHSIRASIIFTTGNEAEAYQYEARLIDKLGLANLTNGNPGSYRMYGQIVKPFKDIDLNAPTYRNCLVRNGADQIDLHIRYLLIDKFNSLVKLRRYAGYKFTPERQRKLDEDIEALQIAIWPKDVEQLPLW